MLCASCSDANLQDVGLTGGELVVNSILDVDNVEASIVTLTVSNDTNTTHVTSTSDHGNGTSVKVDEVGDLASGEVNLDSVVDFDQGVGVADAVAQRVSIRQGRGVLTVAVSRLRVDLFSARKQRVVRPKLDPTTDRMPKLTFWHHA